MNEVRAPLLVLTMAALWKMWLVERGVISWSIWEWWLLCGETMEWVPQRNQFSKQYGRSAITRNVNSNLAAREEFSDENPPKKSKLTVSSWDLAMARLLEMYWHMFRTRGKLSEFGLLLLHTCTSTYTTEDLTQSSGYVSPPRMNSKNVSIIWAKQAGLREVSTKEIVEKYSHNYSHI